LVRTEFGYYESDEKSESEKSEEKNDETENNSSQLLITTLGHYDSNESELTKEKSDESPEMQTMFDFNDQSSEEDPEINWPGEPEPTDKFDGNYEVFISSSDLNPHGGSKRSNRREISDFVRHPTNPMKSHSRSTN